MQGFSIGAANISTAFIGGTPPSGIGQASFQRRKYFQYLAVVSVSANGVRV
jgi:hypothetical protein